MILTRWAWHWLPPMGMSEWWPLSPFGFSTAWAYGVPDGP